MTTESNAEIETKTFIIEKINRTWIAAKLNGYDCKIKISAYSRDIKLGEQELVVRDISIKSKYGTHLRFEVVEGGTNLDERIILDTKDIGFNKILYKLCKQTAGKYEDGLWIFPKFVADKVDELDEIFNSRKVVVEVGFPEGLIIDQDEVSIFGYSVARATSRDSGAIVKGNIAVIKGSFRSGGSYRNWDTRAERDTVIRLEVPELLVETWLQSIEYQKIDLGYNGYTKDNVEIKIIK